MPSTVTQYPFARHLVLELAHKIQLSVILKVIKPKETGGTIFFKSGYGRGAVCGCSGAKRAKNVFTDDCKRVMGWEP